MWQKSLLRGVFVGGGFLIALAAAGVVAQDAQTTGGGEVNAAERAAFEDVSRLVGEPVTTREKARAVCSLEKYLVACAEIGKAQGLFGEEEAAQVDMVLAEFTDDDAELKRCSTTECLLGVAQSIARRLERTNSAVAKQLELTRKDVAEKKEVVDAAKEVGVDFETCRTLDPDSASVELLRTCARLAKHERVQDKLSIEKRAKAGTLDPSLQLKDALDSGAIQCGDNTLNGCGNFCLNPSAVARVERVTGIPTVCREIAVKFFGPEGITELERAYQSVKETSDYYLKRAAAVVFTTSDGRTLTDLREIGRYLEEEGGRGNIDAVERGMDFMVSRGFATPEDKEFALRFVQKIRQGGKVFEFDTCERNPEECREFVPDEERETFDVFSAARRIMDEELRAAGIIGPSSCEGGSDQVAACVAAYQRALPRVKEYVARFRNAEPVVGEIERRITFLEKGVAARRQVEGDLSTGEGFTIGDQTFRTFAEVETFCKTNGSLCLAEAAKRGYIDRDSARERYEHSYEIQSRASQPPPTFPQIAPRVGETQPPPGTPTVQRRTITTKDKEEALRRFEEWLENPIGPPPVPGTEIPYRDEFGRRISPPYEPPRYICPAVYYEPCPDGYYRESLSPSYPGGCPGVGECRPILRKPPSICPSLPTVSDCPGGEEKFVSYSSPECGTYFGCRKVGDDKEGGSGFGNSAIALKRLFPGQYENTKFAVTVSDPEGISEFLVRKGNGSAVYGGGPDCAREVTSSTVTLETADFPLQASVTDCAKLKNVQALEITSPPPVEEKKKEEAVPENTEALCRDGIDNDRDGVTDSGDRDCAPYTVIQSGACTAELISLLGSSCHSMGNAYFNQRMTRYVLPGSRQPIECTTTYIANCTEGDAPKHTPGSCNANTINLLGSGCHEMSEGFFNGEMTKYVRRGTTMVSECVDNYLSGCIVGGQVRVLKTCGASQTRLLGSGCHDMGNAFFDSAMMKYLLPNETTVKECASNYILNCTIGGGGAGTAACTDGRDNDSDGRIDYPADTGCYSAGDSDESFPCASGFKAIEGSTAGTGYCQSTTDAGLCQPVGGGTTYTCPGSGTATTTPDGRPQCSDGRDNDSDGRIDYPADTSCYDGTDNDEYYPPSTGGGGTACDSALTSLLGTGCHQMYNDSSGNPIFCDSAMTKSAKRGDTATTAGCSSPSGGGTTTPQKCFYPNATRNGAYTGYTVWCESDYVNCRKGSQTGEVISLTGVSLGAPSSCESGWNGGPSGYCNNNNYCDLWENKEACPVECANGPGTYVTGTCNNNNYCDSWENATACPADCGGGAGGGCSADIANLIQNVGGGCHSMGTGYFNSAMDRYVLPGTTLVRDCRIDYISGCTAGTGTTVPVAPSGLTTTLEASGADVKLVWTDNSTNETEWKVWRRVAGTWSFLISIPVGGSGGTSGVTQQVTDRAVPSGTVDYMVQACAGVTCSPDSNTATVTVGSGGQTTTSCTTDLVSLLGSGCHEMSEGFFDGEMAKYVRRGTTGVISCSTSYVSGCSSGGSTGGSTACTQTLINLLGTGCHNMGTGYFNGEMTRYVLSGESATKECSTNYISGCTTGGGTGTGGSAQCADGIDNDGDGAVDYPADTGCYGAADTDEAYYPTGGSTGGSYEGDASGECTNGVDDDSDGLVDSADYGCSGGSGGTWSSSCPSFAHEMSGYCMLNSDTSRCAEYANASVEANYTNSVCTAHTSSSSVVPTSFTPNACPTGHYANREHCYLLAGVGGAGIPKSACPKNHREIGGVCVFGVRRESGSHLVASIATAFWNLFDAFILK